MVWGRQGNKTVPVLCLFGFLAIFENWGTLCCNDIAKVPQMKGYDREFRILHRSRGAVLAEAGSSCLYRRGHVHLLTYFICDKIPLSNFAWQKVLAESERAML